jgi:hypothetical protein
LCLSHEDAIHRDRITGLHIGRKKLVFGRDIIREDVFDSAVCNPFPASEISQGYDHIIIRMNFEYALFHIWILRTGYRWTCGLPGPLNVARIIRFASIKQIQNRTYD